MNNESMNHAISCWSIRNFFFPYQFYGLFAVRETASEGFCLWRAGLWWNSGEACRLVIDVFYSFAATIRSDKF
jgi:hypothetical protein